jgi:hypothetical protein
MMFLVNLRRQAALNGLGFILCLRGTNDVKSAVWGM